MAGQVGKLTLKAVIDGFEDVQGLGKALKDISEKAKKTDKAFEITTRRIKEFGKATFKTNEGLKGQISAFEKLRGRTDFQGRAYKNLTLEINSLNKELKERLGLEKQLETGSRKGRFFAGAGDKGLLKSRMDQNLGGGTGDDYARRASALQALLVTRTFDNLAKEQQKFLNDFTKNPFTQKGTIRQVTGGSKKFQELIKESNVKFLATSQYGPGGKLLGGGTHTFGADELEQLGNKGRLNSLQRAALNIQEDLNIASKKYAEVLAKINAEEGVQTRILSAQNAVSKSQVANARAKTIARDKEIALQRTRVKSFLQQQQFDPIAGSLGGTIGATYFGGQQFPGPASREFAAKSPRAQQFQSTLAMLGIKTPTYAAAEKEYRQSISGYEASTQADKTRIRMPKFGDFARGVSDKEIDTILGKRSLFGFKESTLSRIDPMGLGKDMAYPKTDRGITAELQNLQSLLPDLVRGSDEWVKVTEMVEEKNRELNDSIKKGNEALKKRREEIAKAVNPKFNQKLLPPAKKRFVSGDTGFTADQYGPQVETQAQLTKRLQETLRARNLNINSIVKHKSKLEEIRNTLKPTSEAFRSVSKSILEADKALSRINSNKFSGANLRRTGQSILGAGFVGGPAGFLGAGLGAGFEALRPGGDMASGAITGGLVASQVLTPVSQAIGGSTEYASQIEKANIALKGITKTTENYEVAQAAITKAVEEYNVPQEVAIRGMTRLSAAVLGAGGNIHNATEAFLNTTVAIKGTAGSADDVKSAITAMVQIFSKGKVSAEELSGQLGERFPAAVTKFAKANNISTQELQKNLKDGTVGLDMLSKFITSLGKEYAPLAKKIAESNEEAGARAQIAMNKMKIAVGGSLKDVGAQFQIIGAELLTSLVPALTFVGNIAAKVFGALSATVKLVIDNFHEFASVTAVVGGAMAAAAISALKFKIALVAWDLKLVISQIVKFIIGLKALTIAQIKANIAAYANPYVALAAGLTAAAIAAHRFATAQERLIAKLNDGSATEEDVNKVFNRRLEIQRQIKKLEDSDQKRGKKTRAAKIEELKQEYAALTDAIEDYRKAQNGSTEDLEKLKKEFDALLGGGGDAQSPFEKFTEDLDKFDESLQNVAVNGFKKLEDSIMQFVTTGKLAIKDLVTSVLHDLTRLMIRQTITKPLFSAFTSALTGGWGSLAADRSFSGLGPGSALNTPAGSPLPKGANGLVVAKNGIVPYARGGIVNSPTLFPFAKGVGLMGEAGPEAILPLKRGRSGKLGVAMQGGGGGTTNVNYTGPTLNFNGDEYVPRSAVGSIVQAAASKGAALGETATMRSLQNNRSSRGRLGM